MLVRKCVIRIFLSISGDSPEPPFALPAALAGAALPAAALPAAYDVSKVQFNGVMSISGGCVVINWGWVLLS